MRPLRLSSTNDRDQACENSITTFVRWDVYNIAKEASSVKMAEDEENKRKTWKIPQ